MDNARTSSCSLPRELYDHIIDLLASSTSPSATKTQYLRASSLASRKLHARAYHHLCASLSILLEDRKSTKKNIALLTSLRALLHDSVQFPGVGLVYHLRAFTLTLSGEPDQCYEIFKEGKIGDILNALHGKGYGVQRFKVSVRGVYTREFLFNDLDPSSLEGFLSICQSPNLRHLSLSGIKGLPRVLFRGCTLEHLELVGVGVQADADSEGEPVLARVKRITMHSKVPILDLAYPHRNSNVDDPFGSVETRYKTAFASLTDLRIAIYDVEHVPNALSVAGHAASLSSFHIYLFGVDRAQPPPTPPRPTRPTHLFHPLIALHTLKITKQVVCPLIEQCVVNTLRRFLDTCTLPPNLHTLIVGSRSERKLSVTTVGQQEEQEDCRHEAEWARLDGVLCDAPFTRVPKIVIRIEYTVRAADKLEADRETAWRDFDQGAFCARARGLVVDALPRLRSSRSKPSSTDCPKAFEVGIAIIRRQPESANEVKVNFGDPR